MKIRTSDLYFIKCSPNRLNYLLGMKFSLLGCDEVLLLALQVKTLNTRLKERNKKMTFFFVLEYWPAYSFKFSLYGPSTANLNCNLFFFFSSSL
jgi:hypothetical protein